MARYRILFFQQCHYWNLECRPIPRLVRYRFLSKLLYSLLQKIHWCGKYNKISPNKRKKKHQTVLCVNNETSFWKSDSRFLPQDLISDTFSPISDPPFSTGVEPIPILDTISSAWKALPYYICWETHQYLWANIAIDKGTTLFLQLWLICTISSISCVLVCVCLVTVNWIFCT